MAMNLNMDQQKLDAGLLDAIYSRDESRVRSLLAAGADPNARPRPWANHVGVVIIGATNVAGKSAKIVQALLDAGADPNVFDENGVTPLHRAAGKSAEIVQALLASGADPEARDQYDSTPLHWAAGFGNVEAVHALLAVSADQNIRDDGGCTPLHLAAGNGLSIKVKAVEALLSAGADANLATNKGDTPLHFAASRGAGEAFQALLDGGSDPEARNAEGFRPEEVASAAVKDFLAARRASLEEKELLDGLPPGKAVSRSSAL